MLGEGKPVFSRKRPDFGPIEYNTIVYGQYPTLKKITDGFGRVVTFISSGGRFPNKPGNLAHHSFPGGRRIGRGDGDDVHPPDGKFLYLHL
ncbi:MAG: hypothetical protein ABFD52_02675 [Acidobacteriota bacterium]